MEKKLTEQEADEMFEAFNNSPMGKKARANNLITEMAIESYRDATEAEDRVDDMKRAENARLAQKELDRRKAVHESGYEVAIQKVKLERQGIEVPDLGIPQEELDAKPGLEKILIETRLKQIEEGTVPNSGGTSNMSAKDTMRELAKQMLNEGPNAGSMKTVSAYGDSPNLDLRKFTESTHSGKSALSDAINDPTFHKMGKPSSIFDSKGNLKGGSK